MPLDNGGALDLTVGQYFLPSGRNLGGAGTKPGQGLKPDVARQGRSRHEARRGARSGARRPRRRAVSRRQADGHEAQAAAHAARPPPPARARQRASRAAAEGIVATVDKRGRFVVAEPFFTRAGAGERGGRMILERDSRGEDRRPRARAAGDARGRAREGRAAARAAGRRRRRARGVHDRPRTAAPLRSGRRARGDARRATTGSITRSRAATSPRCRRSRSTRVTARDFDDAISAERLDGGRTRIWVHIADVSAYVRPGSLVDREAARRGYERLRPRPRRADAARAALQRRLLARAAAGARRGDGRARLRGRRGRAGALLPLDDPLRRAAGLRAGRPHLRRRGRGAGAVGDAAGGSARRGRRAARAPPAARTRSSSRRASPSSRFDAGGHVAESRPSEQTESHRLIEHLMIAANEQVARLLAERGVPSLYRVHEKPDGESALRLVEQLASLGVATPPVREHMTPSEAAEVDRGLLARGHAARRAHRPRPRRADVPHPALAQAGLLRPEEPRPRRARADALHALHVADPPLPRPRRAPRAAVGGRWRRGGAARIGARRDRRLVVGARARRDVDRAHGRPHRARLPARARAVRERLGSAVRRRGHGPDRRRRVRALRRRPRGTAAGPPPAAATGGSSTSRARS